MFFLRMGVPIGLLGATLESKARGEIGTRPWAGVQGAVVVVPIEDPQHGSRE